MAGRIIHRAPPPGLLSSRHLKRPRLYQALKTALQNPVVAVVAGEGYGKTTSIYSFLENLNVITLWMQLSERDNMGAHFWENFNASLTLRNPELARALMGVGFPETPRQFDRFRGLAEKAINDALPGPSLRYAIVYDDFHLIHNPAMLKLFTHSLASPFPHTSVILISRTEPQVNTLGLLSKGILARITAEDLHFSPEEMAAYFDLCHLKISPEELDSFYRETEGWPQALSLIAQEATKNHVEELHYSRELIQRPSFNMIEHSFFSSLDKAARKFLIKLSLAEHWPQELISEMDTTGKLCERLETISPMIRFDAYLNGYRIHTLLIEFLKEKQGELTREEQREVYQKAAAWCLKNKLRTDAALYYEKAGDYRGLIDLSYTFSVFIPAKTAAFLLGVVENMIEEGEKRLRDGDSEAADIEEPLLYLRHVLRLKLLFSSRRFDEAVPACRQTIAQFEALPPGPFNNRILTATYICLGFVLIFASRHTKNYQFLPYFENAYRKFAEYPFQIAEPLTNTTIPAYICQVSYPAKAGEFEEFIRAFVPVIPLTAKIVGGNLSGLDSLAYCEYYYFKGDMGAAENHARQAIIQARLNHQYEIENWGVFFLLRIALQGGNFPQVEELFGQLKAQLEVEEYTNRYIFYDIECAWFYAQTGNPALIAPWLLNDFEERDMNDIYHPFEALVKAKCFYAKKHYQEALTSLELYKNQSGLESFLLGKLEMTVLEAACYQRMGNRETSIEKLEEAWEISRSDGFDMPFVELGEDMRLLASTLLNAPENSKEIKYQKSQISPEWLESLRSRAAAYGKMILAAADHGPETSQSGKTFLLRRETAVLRALSLGFTRGEIARHQGISLNAVKEIIKSLYQKLGAVNRADAVRIAIAAGLLKNSRH